MSEQLASVRDMQSKLVAEQLRQSAAADAAAQRQSVAVAWDLEEQDKINARIAQHDRAFAQRLASVDPYTWQHVGDEIEEPIEVDPPRKRPCRGGPAGVERGGPGAAGSAAGGPAGRSAAGGAAGPSSTTGGTPSSRMSTRSQQAAPPGGGAAGPSATTSRHSGGASGSGASGSGGAAGPSRGAAAAGGSAAVPPPAAAAGKRGATAECLSCCDRFSLDQVTCAGADGASGSSGAAGCGHNFCRGCLTSYVRGVVRDRKFPVLCPMSAGGVGAAGGCKQQLSRDAARYALRGYPKDLQVRGG